MWWQAVFWILLIPLIIVELIIFLRSRKFFWLVYALSIFTYIVAVSYTIDVFRLGRNAIILILLASAVLMFVIGRQLGKKVRKQKALPALERNIAIAIAAILVLVFVVSVIFGKTSESITAVQSVKEEDMVRTYEQEKGYPGPYNQEVVVLKRTITNHFFMPVPVQQRTYAACVVTSRGTFNIEPVYNYVTENEEIRGGETRTVDVKIQPYYHAKEMETSVSEVRLYETTNDYSYAPCDSITKQPDFTIPVE